MKNVKLFFKHQSYFLSLGITFLTLKTFFVFLAIVSTFAVDYLVIKNKQVTTNLLKKKTTILI